MQPPAVTVWAEARLPGFHRWPGAAGKRAYLALRHRHLFHVRAEAAVTHDDRDIEFHDLRELVTDWWGSDSRDFGAQSCEAIARALADHLAGRGVQVASVSVSEDGECGAVYRPGDGGDA